MTNPLRKAYDRLLAAFGPQHWWPGDSPLEVIIGAVLTQNTAWQNVELALKNLRDEGLLDARALHAISAEDLAELIRPSGYFRLKAKRLKNVVNFIVENYDGDLEAMFSQPLDALREELQSVKGVGPETADSILLYAGNLPTFVVDAYTGRVLKRHGWIEWEADYYAIKDYCEANLDRDAALFNEYHALIVQVGKEYCRKAPRCEKCPLKEMLPESGVVEG